MPIYEYKCTKCGITAEVIQKLSDPPLEECLECSGKLVKQFSPPAIIFKGSGWYVTDFPTKDRKAGIEKESASTGDKNKNNKQKTETTPAKPSKEKAGAHT